ncbi:MAG: hypothetical protein M1511_08320 [Deltaproteobacteria bacterium]|nr:hypothetical protein [Deltaproteobacteria bacterium]
MTPHWLKDFSNYLRSMAPNIEISQEYGRLIQMGDYGRYTDRDVEISCYKNIHCYLEKGLGSHCEEVAKVLRLTDRFMTDVKRGLYRFDMYLFGSIEEHREDNRLGRFLYQYGKPMERFNSLPAWAKHICDKAGTEVCSEGAYFPTCSQIGYEDLAIVFTRSQVQINEKSTDLYRRRKRHFFWFFLDEPEPKFVHGLRFQPDFINVEPQKPDDELRPF